MEAALLPIQQRGLVLDEIETGFFHLQPYQTRRFLIYLQYIVKKTAKCEKQSKKSLRNFDSDTESVGPAGNLQFSSPD